MNRFALLAPVMMGCLALQPGCSEDTNPPSPVQPDADEGYTRGLVYHLDGQDYYLDGPMEGGARDIAGHDWKMLPDGTVAGRHFNTGPFGKPKYWSSDAEDGQLLYRIHGIIDTWSEEKAEDYHSRGYVHYHKLVTVDARQPHPTKIMWARHTAVASFKFDGGPMPWMAHDVEPGVDMEFMHNHHFRYPARERLLYVGCVDMGGQDPDFMLVVGADPEDPETYGKIVHRTDMPEMGDEIHHYGFNVFQTHLLVPGLFSGRVHLLDIQTDPARPALLSYHSNLIADSGYVVPHTVIGMPDGGYLVSMIGNMEPDGPGGLVQLDENGEVVGPFGPAANRTAADTPPHYMYDVGINLIRNRMITTTFGLPKDVGGAINPAGLGNEVYVWDYKERKVLQTVDLGPQTGALEVRWLEEPGSTIGFTNAPGTSEIWRWHDVDLDGVYEFELAIKLPEGSIPTDMLISSDDKFLYVSNWMGNNVMQFDIRNPFNPVLVSQVPMPDSQMMRLSPDNRRLYVTNSLLSTWDDTEFPTGVTRNKGYGIFLIDVDHENGGMTVNPDFHVDLMNVQKKNTVGAARPHQVFFDPGVLREFGAH
jgi:selenium-binding protein 1